MVLHSPLLVLITILHLLSTLAVVILVRIQIIVSVIQCNRYSQVELKLLVRSRELLMTLQVTPQIISTWHTLVLMMVNTTHSYLAVRS